MLRDARSDRSYVWWGRIYRRTAPVSWHRTQTGPEGSVMVHWRIGSYDVVKTSGVHDAGKWWLLSTSMVLLILETSVYRPGLSVSDRPGTRVSGRRLSAYFRRHYAPTPIDRHSDLRRPAFKQQLRRPVFCSCRTTSVEHVASTATALWQSWTV